MTPGGMHFRIFRGQNAKNLYLMRFLGHLMLAMHEEVSIIALKMRVWGHL